MTAGTCRLCGLGWLNRIEEETSNLELRTLNFERRMRSGIANPGFRVQCSKFEVRSSQFFSCVPRRVMGAWWPSRSSKPLSARLTSRGMFDSYPLRQLLLRFTICDLRFEEPTPTASPTDRVVNRKSQIENSKKGGGRHVARTGP